MGWMFGVRIPEGAGDFSLLHRVQTSSGFHPATYPVGTGGSVAGDKAAVARSSTRLHLLPVLRMAELYCYSPACLHTIMLNYVIKYRDNFSFILFYMLNL
jgi:hypothetical protein